MKLRLNKIYRLELKRKGITCNEEFAGNFFALWIYKFKMRKWKITVK